MKYDSSSTGVFRRLIQLRFGFRCVSATAVLSLLFIAFVLLRWQGDGYRPEAGVNVSPQQSGSPSIEIQHAITKESTNNADSLVMVVSSDQGERNTSPLMRVTLEFVENDIDLNFHLGKEGRGYSKGERVSPGHISFWTGWMYPQLRELGEGDHSIVYQKDGLSQQQRLSLRIDP